MFESLIGTISPGPCDSFSEHGKYPRGDQDLLENSRASIKFELDRLRCDLEIAHPPFYPEDLFTSFKVGRVERLPINRSGYTLKTDSSYVIIVNSTERAERQRFTIAHELGHIAADQLNLSLDEASCDWFAAEILMPETAFVRSARAVEPSPESVLELCRAFHVSPRAAVRRLTDLLLWNVLFVWWRAKSLQGHRFALRVVGWDKRKDDHFYVPLDKSADESSAVAAAFAYGEPIDRTDQLKLGNLRGAFRVRALRLDNGTVLSTINTGTDCALEKMVWRDRPPFQLSLFARLAVQDVLATERAPKFS